MFDLEVLSELTSGTEVGKERKKRLEVSLKISQLELVGSCSFLPRSCSLFASRCLSRMPSTSPPSPVVGAPPSLSRAHSFFATFRIFVTFHFNEHLLHRYKEHFSSETLQGGHDGTKTTQRFPRTKFAFKISQRTRSFVKQVSCP